MTGSICIWLGAYQNLWLERVSLLSFFIVSSFIHSSDDDLAIILKYNSQAAKAHLPAKLVRHFPLAILH